MAILKSKLVVGAGDFLDIAFHAWKARAPDIDVQRHEVAQDRSHNFDLSFLDGHSPTETSMFVAFDNRFLNFKRLELMGAIKGRGFRMEPYIGAAALVGSGARVGENSFIADGAVVGDQAHLHHNIWLGPRAVVGYAAQIGHSVWVEAAVVVGARARIGAHSILGGGVSIADQVQVGKMCVLGLPGHYAEDIPAKAFYRRPFAGPIRIFN